MTLPRGRHIVKTTYFARGGVPILLGGYLTIAQIHPETPIQHRASLFVRTGANCPFAPVGHLRSRHLDTPTHKNSLAVSENASSRDCLENRRRVR